tara:strand:+ start:185 stop:484 length:300 start_codon:yes stop_codon:yes gene_type:complete
MLKWLREEPPDWSDVERLEQRIRDIRRRIREAKSAQEPVLSSHGVESRLQNTARTVEALRLKSLNARASLEEGPKVSEESRLDGSEAQRLKEKLLGKNK